MYRHRFALASRGALLVTLTALGGCGIFNFGGDAAAPTGMVMGMALKGVLKNALVTVKEIVPGATPKILGRACTDATGNYALTYSGYSGGPMLISVDAVDAATGGCLGNNMGTKSTCDAATGCGATAFGADFDIPPATKLNLHALIDRAASVQMAAITPFSEAAARNALRATTGVMVTDVDAVNLSTMDAAGLALLAQQSVAARRKIEKLPLFASLGASFNLLTTQPADITKVFARSGTLSADENRAAGFGLLCGAVLQAFFSDGGSTADPAAALRMATDKLARAFTSNGILNDDSGDADATAFSLRDLTDAAKLEAKVPGGAETKPGYSGSNITAQETASNGKPGFSNPPPDATSLLSWNFGNWDLSVWQ